MKLLVFWYCDSFCDCQMLHLAGSYVAAKTYLGIIWRVIMFGCYNGFQCKKSSPKELKTFFTKTNSFSLKNIIWMTVSALQVIWVIILLVIVIKELKKLCRQKSSYFSQNWNIVECCHSVLRFLRYRIIRGKVCSDCISCR